LQLFLTGPVCPEGFRVEAPVLLAAEPPRPFVVVRHLVLRVTRRSRVIR
jgi:hypothetical protein